MTKETTIQQPAAQVQAFPVSHAQQRLWFLEQLQQGSSAYHIPWVCRLKGPLNVAALEKAVNEIIARHEALRTNFQMQEGRLLQVIAPSLAVTLPITVVSGVDEAAKESQARELVMTRIRRPFDLKKDPLLRISLLHLSENEHILLVIMHHIVSDGWSMSVFQRELATLYECFCTERPSPLPELPIQYVDFALWQRELLQGDTLEQLLSYWRKQLQDAPELLEISTDYGRPATQTYRGAMCSLTLDPVLIHQLRNLSQQTGATQFMVMMAVFQLLLHRYSGQDQTVVGTPIAGRNQVQVQNLIGLFLNTLAIGIDHSGNPTFLELLERVKQASLGAYAHGELPFDKLVENLQLRRSVSHTPLFQVFFNLINFDDSIGLPGLEISEYPLDELDSKFDFTLYVMESKTTVRLDLVYNSDLFSSQRMQEMLRQFSVLLQQVVSSPDGPASEFSLRTDAIVLPDPERAFTGKVNELVPARFIRQAAAGKDRVALLDNQSSWQYGTLENRSNQLAHRLRACGIQRGDIVVILGERCASLIWTMLGVLKAGAAFAILDPSYPTSRLIDSVQAIRPTGWITLDSPATPATLIETLVEAVCCKVVLSLPGHGDTARQRLFEEYPETAPTIAISGEDPAYVVLSSGTTGTPHAIVTPHAALAHFLDWHTAHFGLHQDDSFSLFSGLSHDPVMRDVFSPLWVGATLCIPERATFLAPKQLRSWLRKQQISVAHVTPSLLKLLVQGYESSVEKELDKIRYVFSGGDVLTYDSVARFHELAPAATCVNFYGASETPQAMAFHVVSTGWLNEAPHRQTVPLGTGTGDVQLLVVSRAGQMAGVGELGEIYIRTPYLSLGYANNAALTGKKFITNPFTGVAEDRVYRTGDLGRYLPDGSVEFHGRSDGQLKVRGFRIEAAEVEKVLCRHEHVSNALVCVRKDETGNELLVAYLVCASNVEQKDLLPELKSLVRSLLPEYMVPAVFMVLEALPLTPNNKVNYRALPVPVNAGSKSGRSPVPLNSLEHEIAAIWRDILPIKDFGRDENFFDLGGNSLLLAAAHHSLEKLMGRELPLIDLFRYPSVALLAEHLATKDDTQKSETAELPVSAKTHAVGAIAVIGMSAKFPGASNVDEYWQNLCVGKECIEFFTDEELASRGVEAALLRNPHYVKAGAVLKGIQEFDAGFFGMNPREAELTDPQQRLALECAWEALESAGYDPERYPEPVGVFAGASASTYLFGNILENQELLNSLGGFSVSVLHGNEKDYLPTRISYKLGLRGPSIAVQTACSSSLVAISRACQSLLSGECDMALAGGSSANVWQDRGYLYQTDSILSPDGHCRAFDAQAQGTIFSSGAGFVVLRRLEDALADGDQIIAVIRGWATNNDGAQRIGYTAPSVDGQASVISAAITNAGVTPDAIGYVETHGTGTTMGDPIEVAALTRAFSARTEQKQFCAIGSVKTNVGHLNAAAGVAGFIKAALTVQHGFVPPSLNYREPNPQIHFGSSPFYVNTEARPWDAASSRIAGVSSFGIGGTNAHVIVEQPPAVPACSASRPVQLLVLSAQTDEALRQASRNLGDWLHRDQEQSLADVAYTLATGRKQFAKTMAVLCESKQEAANRLLESQAGSSVIRGQHKGGKRRVVMLFSGQGSQYLRMGAQLYKREPVFRTHFSKYSERLKDLIGVDLRQIIFAEGESQNNAAELLRQTWLTQPALYAFELALLKLWETWGIQPDAMMGHSLGELVAATAAGVLSEDDGLSLVAERGRLMWQTEAGAMLAAILPEHAAQSYLRHGVCIAAINGPEQVVFSGDDLQIAQLEKELVRDKVILRRLDVPRAFHSEKMESIRNEFMSVLQLLQFRSPVRPYISNVSGTWAGDEVTHPEYWWEQVRKPVQFLKGIRTLAESGAEYAWLEVGPGETLANLVRAEFAATGQIAVVASTTSSKDIDKEQEHLLRTLGDLWVNGVSIDWTGYYRPEKRRKVALPTYPFQRQKYWIQPGKSVTRSVLRKQADLADWFYVPSWKRSQPLAAWQSESLPNQASAALVFADETKQCLTLLQHLRRKGQRLVVVHRGETFQCLSQDSYAINPRDSKQYAILWQHLVESNCTPETVFHLWLLGADNHDKFDALAVEEQQYAGFYSLLYLTQAVTESRPDDQLRIVVAVNGLHDVCGEPVLNPARATILGPCRVIPQEHAKISVTCVDLPVAANDRSQDFSANLLTEATTDKVEVVVAYRNGYRWVQTFEPTRLKQQKIQQNAIKPNGVYLITGGMGGIGLTLAEHFAHAEKVKIALVGRSDFPEREDWRQNHDASDEISRKISKLLALEAAGAEVMVCQADVSDAAQIEDVVSDIRKRFGKINGVVHAAGVPGGGVIALKTDAAAHAVIAPKLTGTLNLARLFQNGDLDFFALCSSRASILGGVGQVDYCGANNFLDAFAHYYARAHGAFTVAINWGAWQEVGMAVDAKIPTVLAASRRASLDYAIAPKEGVAAFDRILASPLAQVVVSPQNLKDFAEEQRSRDEDNRTRGEGSIHTEVSNAAPATHARPELSVTFRAPESGLEGEIAAIWEQFLGVAPVGADDDFLELGGHSLLATQVISRLRSKLGIEIGLRTLFQNPTVATLALAVAAQHKNSGESRESMIPSTARDEALPLSFAQQRLWLLDQIQRGSSAYNIFFAIRLTGMLDVSALQHALGEVVHRHESLRTTFPEVEGQVVQKISSYSGHGMQVCELQIGSEETASDYLNRILSEEAHRPFDLAQGPLFRSRLIRVAEQEHILQMTMHHIVSDGWSIGILVREIAEQYDAHLEGRLPDVSALPVQYADYAVWQREWLTGSVKETQLAYWKKQLSGVPNLLQLPTDHPRPRIPSMRGSTESALLKAEFLDRLHQLSREQGATLFMVLLAAFNVLLSRYSGQKDIAVGSPIAGRNRTEIEDLVGFFVNALVLRSDLDGDPTFSELLARVREICLSAYAHQDLPFEMLVDELQVERSLGHSPIFQVVFVLQNAPRKSLELKRLTAEYLPIESNTAKFDLTLTMQEAPAGLQTWMEYNTDLFDASTIQRMLGHLNTLLEGVAAAPEQRISALPMLTSHERRDWIMDRRTELPSFATSDSVSSWFEKQAQQTPEAIALTFEGKTVKYQELNCRANQLARHLHFLGVAGGDLVGICLDRSIEMVVSILGVLKAGAAYVPMDPAYPADRLNFILADSKVAALIIQSGVSEHLTGYRGRIVNWGDEKDLIARQREENLDCHNAPESIAYVIYTSGSTGRPKGVTVTHGNTTRLLRATEHWFEFAESDVWTLFHSYAFDFSVWEIWGALLYGGKLVIVPYWVSRTPEAFHALLVEQRVTVLNQTPSAFRQLILANQQSGPVPLHLRYVIFGGEALDPKTLQPWINRYGDQQPRLINMYGITETTVHVTYRSISQTDLKGARSVIGVPIPDLRLNVLDEHMEPVPVGIAGEIFVGGDGLAIGYLNRPELTAERFVPDPFSQIPGARLYRSGDVARPLAGGDLEYLGRSDHQVKIRGFRIELGEIEAVLTGHPSVREAVVVARADADGSKRLVAYLVPAGEEKTDIPSLRAYLTEKLPDHMVPSAYVSIERIPLTEHGKLNHRALPEPRAAAITENITYVAPQNQVENILAKMWGQVLGIETVGIDDNFFALGGDSIRSIQLRALARAQGLEFSLQQLFQHQTIRLLAMEITSTVTAATSSHADIINLLSADDRSRLPATAVDAYPLTMLQTGMVFHSELDHASAVYHDIFSYRVRSRFDVEKFREAVVLLASQHPILRTSFDLKTFSVPLQIVYETIVPPVETEDLRHLPDARQDQLIESWIENEKLRSFDWEKAPLFRFCLHRRSDDTLQISFSFHHAILDGWSVASLLTELFQIYAALLNGTGINLQPLATAFREYVGQEQMLLASKEAQEFWAEYVADAEAVQVPVFNTDRGASQPRKINAYRVAVPVQISDELKKVAAANSVPVKSVLLAAHLSVLRRLCWHNDVMTGLVTNGRPEKTDGDRVLGLFLNTLPFRLKAEGGSWSELIQATFTEEKRMLPFRAFPLAQIQKMHDGQPLFDTVFNFIHFHVYDNLEKLSGVEVLQGQAFEETNFSLVANFSLVGEKSEVSLNLLYDSTRLGEDQIHSIAGYYLRALTASARTPEQQYQIDDLLSIEERRKFLAVWKETQGLSVAKSCVHQLFREQALKNPDQLGVAAPNLRLTYGELDKITNQLAHYLKNLGVGPEARAGVCVENGAEMVIGALGILKSGGAYLPMDAAYPVERRSFMMRNSGARVVVTVKKLAETFVNVADHIVVLDNDPACFTSCPETPVESGVFFGNVAYTIYTSGSTGSPKGVDVSHGALLNLVGWHQQLYKITPQDRASQIASLGFDASVWEVWPYLTAGAQLHVPDKEQRLSTRKLAQWLIQTGITLAFLPTPLAEAILEEEEILGATSLSALLTGGDQLRHVPATNLPFRLINHYGPTENAVVATSKVVAEGQSNPPIGRPISNVQVFVLDSHMLLSPVGVPGELYIAGYSLARGYTGDPEQTALKFVPDQFSLRAGSRLYRTGDLVRWLPNGDIEFLGRIDQQVKLRGYRIELGEIEAILKACDPVREAAVVAREDLSGSRHLVAYIATPGTPEAVEEMLRARIADSLPEYMQPRLFVFLDQIPLTVNGKIDRKRLPEPNWLHLNLSQEHIAPGTPLQIEIARIWTEVLGCERVGLKDNFFHAGGDSLKAIRAVARISDALGMDVSLSLLFDAPDLESFAAAITQRKAENLTTENLDELLQEIDAISEEEARSLLASQASNTAQV